MLYCGRGRPPRSAHELIAENEDAARELPPAVRATLDAEKRYRGALKDWNAYETWRAERNPGRAELERRHGYDTKHGAHLVRLMRMGLEVLVEGELRVRRKDAEVNRDDVDALLLEVLELATTNQNRPRLRPA